jgi:quercetin dioxygenase-like cupin family protein
MGRRRGEEKGASLKRVTAILLATIAALAFLCQQVGFPVATPFAALAEELTPVVISSEVLGRATPAAVDNPELALARVTIMPGAAIPKHYHVGTQIASIVQGTLTYTVFTGEVLLYRHGEDATNPHHIHVGETVQLAVGDTVVETPGSHHQAINNGTAPVVIYLSTLFPAGAPRSVTISATPTH